MLAHKAVTDYKKSIESNDDLSNMDEGFECDNVHITSMNSVLYFF